MAYKPFQLGMYAKKRELEILKDLQKNQPLHYLCIGGDMLQCAVDCAVSDLDEMGLIKFDTDTERWSLTKKAEKFLTELEVSHD